MTGVGVAVETAVEPDEEADPAVMHDGGQGISSAVLAVPFLETTKTSSAKSDVALSARRARSATSRLADEGIENWVIEGAGFIYSQIQAESFFDSRMENYAITLAACARSGQLILLFGASHVHAHIFMRGFFQGVHFDASNPSV